MPSGSTSIVVEAPSEEIFDLIHDYDRRLEWDSFLREATLLEGATQAGLGITSRCTARLTAGGLAMETVYVSYKRPDVAAVRMTCGPAIFRNFAATIRQQRLGKSTTQVTYNYNFQTKPGYLAPLFDPVVEYIFHRETRGRLIALSRFLEATKNRQ